ncbi:hypothetical protein [Thermococcus sp. JCM 11816]|uniref:hypothetical protein n=1 Tax=Thermococcus sp. (strain JCM 11816 / KS-1) TaxID=1295125 RepID=UPI0006D1E8AB
MKGQVLFSDAQWLKVTLYHEWFWKAYLEHRESYLLRKAKRRLRDGGVKVNTKRGWEEFVINIFELEKKYVVIIEAVWASLALVVEVEKSKVKYLIKKLRTFLNGSIFDNELVWFHLAYDIQYFDRDAVDIENFWFVIKESFGWEVVHEHSFSFSSRGN